MVPLLCRQSSSGVAGSVPWSAVYLQAHAALRGSELSHDLSQTIPGQYVILLEGRQMKGSVDSPEAEHELGQSQAGAKKNQLNV